MTSSAPKTAAFNHKAVMNDEVDADFACVLTSEDLVCA